MWGKSDKAAEKRVKNEKKRTRASTLSSLALGKKVSLKKHHRGKKRKKVRFTKKDGKCGSNNTAEKEKEDVPLYPGKKRFAVILTGGRNQM